MPRRDLNEPLVVIHHVFANRSNAGDWLSAIGIQQLLGPASVVEHLCDQPFADDTLNELKRTQPGDLIVIGGGGLLMEYFTPFWTGFLPIARQTPFCLWGVGACDIMNTNSLPPRELVQEIASLSQICVVRDDLTREFLGLATIPTPVPCPTLNALEDRCPQPAGIVLHVDHYSNVGPANFEKMEQFATAHAQATGRKHRKINNLLPAGQKAELEKIIDVYGASDVVLTSRLHGCIIAAALDRPFLAVSGDRKVDSFMHAAGLQRWLCPLSEVDSIPDRLADLERERPSPKVFVQESREANRKVATQVRGLLQGDL